MFASNFMQQTAELIGEKVHGDKHALGVKKVAGGGVSCGGKWAIFFSFGGTVQFPGIIGFHNNGYSLGLGFTVSLGCRSGILYPDFLFDFAGGKKIFGLKLPTVSKFGVAGTLGFNIASPSNDIVQASGAVDIAGSLIVGTPPSSFKIKVGIGFKILPLPDIPMGFAVQLAFAFGQTPAPRTGSVKGPNGAVLKSNQAHLKFPATPPALEQESEEQEEAEETSLEDSIYSTVGRSVKALLEHDFEDMFESGRFMAAMEIGASAMGNVKGNTANTAFPIAPEELAVSAGLKMKFCITCLPGIRAVNDGTVMKNPYAEPYAGHAFDTRRRRTAVSSSLSLANRWSSYGGSYGTATVGVGAAEMCAVEGLVKHGGWGHVATLPDNCRPRRRLIFSQNNHQYSARVDVLTNGNIYWIAGGRSHSWLSLSGINFPTTGESNLGLGNRWASYGGSYGTASYKVTGQLCMVNGLVKHGGWGHVATLPHACRPRRRLIFNLNNHQYSMRVDVLTSGHIYWIAGGRSHSWMSLSGINFPTTGESNLPLANRWASYGGSYGTASYKTGLSGFCSVTGLVKHGGWGHVATLPSNCRPNRRLIFNLNNHQYSARVDVLTNGVIHWIAGGRSHSWLSLSGIIFQAATR